LVVKHSSNGKHISKTSSHAKEKTAKKVESKVKRPSSGKQVKSHLETETEQISKDIDMRTNLQIEHPIRKSNRPEDEVVTYNEVEFELKEISSENRVLIGPPRLTRFERARISGARSLQLSLGAPSLIRVPNDIRDSITLAVAELDLKALPISIRRILPNGLYQDISIDILK
jgi:DNA-directed RNA polymerases I, II, and III subunit RPABC2